MNIIPSIISTDLDEIKDKLARLDGLVAFAELDVMDGVFVPNTSWRSPEDLKNMDGKIKLSAHLMVSNPETVVADWQNFVDRVVVHFESTDKMPDIVEKFHDKGNPCELGIALELETPVEKIFQYLDKVKVAQLMSVANIGYYGEKFDERVIEKIKVLREKWPDVKIIVDGGIDPAIAMRLKEAGASAVVVGSYVWNVPVIEEAIRDFQSLSM